MISALGISIANAAKWLWLPAHRKWVLVAITVAACIAMWLHWQNLREEAQEARTEAVIAQRGVKTLERARRADDAAVASRGAMQTTIIEQEDRSRVRTEEAAARHPAWANEPVPADVLGSLRD